jgi:protein involved in polysaccharide export with SLBB domain
MKIKRTIALQVRSLFSWRLPASALVLAALVEVTGCGHSSNPGVFQLPTPPARQETTFSGAAPQNGPPVAPINECKQAFGNYQSGTGTNRLGEGNYKLGTGDKIRVVVLQDSEFSGDYEVDPAGQISARMLGPIKVAGLTTIDVEAMLRESYRSSGFLVAPRLSVELVAARPFYVVGEVTKNGAFPYTVCLHVIQAIAIAGGYTKRAGRTRMTIRRFYPVSAEEEYVTEDTLVEPGDVIRVPERYF